MRLIYAATACVKKKFTPAFLAYIFIEVMADERWKRLAEQQGVAYAKTVAEAMKLKVDADNPGDREKLRRAVLDLVAPT
ncbi:MAG: hypothetical protein WA849_04415 [Candidatus Udaeobacter sp.]